MPLFFVKLLPQTPNVVMSLLHNALRWGTNWGTNLEVATPNPNRPWGYARLCEAGRMGNSRAHIKGFLGYELGTVVTPPRPLRFRPIRLHPYNGGIMEPPGGDSCLEGLGEDMQRNTIKKNDLRNRTYTRSESYGCRFAVSYTILR